MSERHLEIVWDAIALHTTAEIPSRKGGEVALCQLGIAADLGIAPPEVVGAETIDEVLAAYPWLDMHESLPTALVGLFHKNPKAASSNPVAEACERRVSGFKRFNLCDRLVDTHAQRNGRVPTMKVTVKGVNLNVAQAGSGEHALVFLHFWGGSSREWSSVIDGLSPRFHCVALDARGSGASDAPRSGYRIADLADDVEGVIAALKLKSYVLVGHSMGGKTAQLLASRRPQGLRGLALVASSPPTPMATSPDHRDQLRKAYASRDAVNWGLNNVLTASPISDKDREVLVADALQVSPGLGDGWIDVATQEDYSSEVAKVDVPVVVIAGDADKVDPLDVVKAHILPAFRNPETHFLKNKGHLLPIEAPRELVEILGQSATRAFA